MCPSFQATREEVNSTRGRANLLRAFISNVQLTQGMQRERQEAAYGALDMCLACKACKAECPSGVDMAKLKYEFQHDFYKSHRRHLRDYLFAYIGPLVQLGAPFGRVANWFMTQDVVRKGIDPIFRLARKRELPKFIPHSRIPDSRFQNLDYRESVILLRDTFTHFFEPEIERAALDVLSE